MSQKDSKTLMAARMVLEGVVIEELAMAGDNTSRFWNTLEASFVASFGRRGADTVLEFAQALYREAASMTAPEKDEFLATVIEANEKLCGVLQLTTLQERLQFVSRVYTIMSHPVMDALIEGV